MDLLLRVVKLMVDVGLLDENDGGGIFGEENASATIRNLIVTGIILPAMQGAD